jgi:hypothetical protein
MKFLKGCCYHAMKKQYLGELDAADTQVVGFRLCSQMFRVLRDRLLHLLFHTVGS